MSTYENFIRDREFDWFAIDNQGNFAIFSTAGEGAIPSTVIDAFNGHDELSEKLESANWGTAQGWSNYSDMGFFVFDWDLPGGPYKKIKEPSSEVSEELKIKLVDIAVVMDVNFSEMKIIESL